MAIIVHKQRHGGKVKGFAPGDALDTATPQPTPPPTKPLAPDVISRPRAPVGAGYGQSGGAENPSSIAPGYGGPQTQLGKNLEASVDGDGLLARIRRLGTSKGVIDDVDLQSPQTRNEDYADAKFPAHPNMKPANVGGAPRGTVPLSTGASPYADEIRRQQAALAAGNGTK